ncbi:lipase [Nocardioides marmoriginsengisoli]|uniref:Lipase n=1 Tax=Nocardioides marmoriginsengisoli TaxID=661483 RepID=A0A3N0C935_9ACTN|nr:lipase family protein [Nocardioides marmoriginsengisoli]RNL59988.1 lipase [Nocardioides marmoriginsengisoli]
MSQDPGSVLDRAVRFALTAVGARKLEPNPADPFYDPPGAVPSEPGTVLKAEPARFYIDPFKLIPAPARVERIMFTTTDRLGRVIPVTGTVLTPTRPRSKRDDRGLVAFAVGTQGMGTQCAPSRQLAAGREYESVFITGLLARGYNVVVPDYQGLGMDGTHTYMSREVQGRVVLDALRASQQLDHPDIPVAGPVAIAGYSQGGGAAASAAELWHEYAADLDVKGAVCGAVPADFPLVARMLDGSPYFAFLGYALVGLSSDYDIDLRPLLNERGLEVAGALAQQCMFESLRRYAFTRSSSLTADGRSIGTLLGEEPFATIVAEQQLGAGRYPRTEALVSHSRLDDVVPFECGRGLAERWAGQGGRVRLSVNLAPTHAAAALTSYGTAFAFLNGRFAGKPMRANTKRYLHSLVDPAVLPEE